MAGYSGQVRTYMYVYTKIINNIIHRARSLQTGNHHSPSGNHHAPSGPIATCPDNSMSSAMPVIAYHLRFVCTGKLNSGGNRFLVIWSRHREVWYSPIGPQTNLARDAEALIPVSTTTSPVSIAMSL